MVFGLFKNYPIFRYIIYDFLKKVSRGSRPTCLAKILCALHYTTLHYTTLHSLAQYVNMLNISAFHTDPEMPVWQNSRELFYGWKE